jgi:hypothetical protein
MWKKLKWSAVWALGCGCLLFGVGPAWAGQDEPVLMAAANTPVAVDAKSSGASASKKSAAADDEQPDAAPATAKPAIGAGTLLWSPRTDRGAPALREGGATRGVRSGLAVLTLVPPIDAAALSLGAQPVLHWYLSADSPYPVEFTLVDPDEIDPIVEVTLRGSEGAGIHTVDLAEHGVELEAGRAYQWYVAVVPDREKRSSDVLARAMITRVDEPELEARVAQAGSNAEAVRMLAAAGIWYEALDQARRDAAESPADAAAQQRLDMLLDQVGIDLPVN